MRFIRWQGGLVFIAIIVMVLAVFYFFAGNIAKSYMEEYGAQYTGAEVNIESVDVELMPFALQVTGLEATDLQKPQINMVSFDHAVASLDLWQLIFGRTIIESLDVSGLAFGQQRAVAGEVYRQSSASENGSKEQKQGDWLDDMQQNLPDPEELLKNSNLKTVKHAAALEQTYKSEKQTLAQIKQQLPNKEKLKTYEQKVKALSKVKVKSLADFEKIKRDFDQLKAEFKQEQAQLKIAKEKLLTAKEKITANVSALKSAPQEDWQDISTKYQLSSIEAEDFAHLLFGEKAREYYQWAEIVLEHIRPLLTKSDTVNADAMKDLDAKSKGRFVHFVEESPMPSFWLKKANLSLKLNEASYQVLLNDVTHQHWLIDKQSSLTVNADDKEKVGTLAAKVGFSIDATSTLTADGDWSLNQLPLNDIKIKETEAFNLDLVHALLNVMGKFMIEQGQLTFNSDFALSDNEFTGSASSKLANVVIDTLSNTEALNLALSANGDWLAPQWQVNSELDNLLSDAFKQQVSAKLDGFKQELQTGLNAKMGDSLSLGEGQLTELLDIETLLNDSEKAFENLVESDVVKQQKKKLEGKAKDKLKEKLGKLFG